MAHKPTEPDPAYQPAPVSDALQPLGRRARKAQAARQALFAAGLAAFERQPIGLVSVLDITEAADVAKGLFYLHFRSKDEYLTTLLEFVHNEFLDLVRGAARDARSRAARLRGVVSQFATYPSVSPAAARYWVRMSSYFPDEVGEPGCLSLIHRQYIEQLAAIIAGCAVESISRENVRTAMLLDAICWAVLRMTMTTGEPFVDNDTMVRMISACTKLID